MNDITPPPAAQRRYQPRNGSGIVDTVTGRFHERDYGPVGTQDTVLWLNERAGGYPTIVVAADRAKG